MWQLPVPQETCAGPGAAPSLQQCTNLLADSVVYYSELDSPTQRAALLDFYDSTGGQYWADQPEDDFEHNQISQVIEGIVEAGNELASGNFNPSTIPSELVSDAASIPALSADCALQQYLSLGQQWLTYRWGSNVSYCYWSGITCCQTVSYALFAAFIGYYQLKIQMKLR